MKNIIYCIVLLLIVSCGNNSHQQAKEIADSTREKLLQEKKQRLSISNSQSDFIDYNNINWGDIQFSPYVPPYPELGNDGIKLLETKISALISNYGISGNSGNPSFVIIPAINILTKNVTSTAPTMFANTYDVTFYTACLTDGTIFSSTEFTFKGVGESPIKAFVNGLSSAKLDEIKMTKMISDGKDKALKYYEAHCNEIVTEAKNLAALKQFNEAILLLKAIPKQVDCYKNSSDLLDKYFKMSLSENCNRLLVQMKAQLGNQGELGGFNANAMSYYAMIPMDGPCAKEAQIVYSSYIKKLNPKARLQWEKDEREFNLRKDKQEQDHTYAMTKAELESKTAIEGQTALLEKYKKDHEYEKLPWLRKLVHLGEWDPFDATSKVNK